MQMAWAGEMEGWLTSPPDWHLVADAMLAAQWEPVLRAGLEQPIEVVTPLASRELAGRNRAPRRPRGSARQPDAARIRHALPAAVRGSPLDARSAGVSEPFTLLGVASTYDRPGNCQLQDRRVERQVAQLGPNYTNAMQLKARYPGAQGTAGTEVRRAGLLEYHGPASSRRRSRWTASISARANDSS